MKKFYEFKPVDTLFFRGAEPMESGQLAANVHFPPPTSVIQGALRTAVMLQKGLSPAEYAQGNADLEKLIGKKGEDAPFAVTVIFIKKEDEIYAPAPYSWFVDQTKDDKEEITFSGKTPVFCGPVSDTVRNNLGIITGTEKPPLVKVKHEAKSIGGNWIRFDLLKKPPCEFGPADVAKPELFYRIENRTGISLDNNRKAIEGRLYSANHIRLLDEVTLLIGINRDIGLAQSGILQLGGEQRVALYNETRLDTSFNTGSTSHFMAGAPVKADNSMLEKVVASGKVIYVAGWDMHIKFHKPTTAWFPAGAVFNENINNNLIPVA